MNDTVEENTIHSTANPGADPTSGTTPATTTAPATTPVQAAHETFVKPGRHHEQHLGIDGPIGRRAEVSGLQGTDARRTSTVAEVDHSLDPSNPDLQRPEDNEPTLTERNASLGEGRVIEPTTGLPMNVGKYGTGSGGTDGAPQIHGFDAHAHAEKLSIADETRRASKEITWEKIKENDTAH